MLKLSNIKIPYKIKKEDYGDFLSKKLKMPLEDITSCRLIKRSLDARHTDNIHYVCTFAIEAKNEQRLMRLKGISIEKYLERKYSFPYADIKSDERIVIIGSGPSGLFCALCLARAGLRPIIIERGEMADERKETIRHFQKTGALNINSNIQFGEGGAGTFSDGKLTCRVNDERMGFVLEEFFVHGAPDDIITNSKPHIGTDYLLPTVKNIRAEICSLGGEFMFNTMMQSIDISKGRARGIDIINVKTKERGHIDCDRLILALGHSSRESYEMLLSKGFKMERKPFSMGLRIEHRREYINRLQYKDAFLDIALPTADYRLSCHTDTGSAYSFCMCPGGEVVCGSSEEDAIVTNGMSRYDRMAQNSNSALLVGISPDDIEGDDVLGGMELQRELEKKAYELGGGGYIAPCQRVSDFLADIPSETHGEVIPSYKPGVRFCNLNDILPDFIKETLKKALIEFDRKMPGFLTDDALLTGVETRSSAPVRILRDDTGEANVKAVYPIGEGAGYAGGIMSSAVDGIKCAERICACLANANDA